MPDTPLASLLREALRRRGHGSQKQLARHLNIDASNVSKWVTGKAEPEISRWRPIEEFLDLSEGSLPRAMGYGSESAPEQAASTASPAQTVEDRLNRLERVVAVLLRNDRVELIDGGRFEDLPEDERLQVAELIAEFEEGPDGLD